MKKTGKKLMSLFLSVIMAFGALPFVAFAESENVTTNSDVELTATNTIGKLMTEAFDDVSAQGDSYISDVTFANSTATVTFGVAKTAKLVVAAYDAETNQMLDSEVVSVTSSDTEKSVSFDIEMPEVFLIKAFLLDGNNKALCDAYSRKVDPKAYEEFMSKTTDDFKTESVINLDNSKTNNFLVLADGVKKVSGSDKVNVLQSVDGDTYIFTNIDSALKALKAGDVFYLDNGDVNELTVIKIKSISINGSTATVVADEAGADELFEFVKISDEADETSFVIEDVGENFSVENDVQSSASTDGGHMSENQPFTLTYYENNVSASGTVNLGIESTYFYYFSDEYSDVSFVISPSFGMDISFSGTIAKKEIEYLKISAIINGIKVELGLNFVFSASAKVSLSGTWSAAVGARWDSVNGVANLSRRPEFKPEVKVEGKFFIGAEIGLSASLIDKRLVGIALEGGLGVVITATLSKDTDIEHSCKKCIDGDLGWEAGIDLSMTILKINDKTGIKISAPLWSGSGKFCDFYYSFDFEDFGFTECPHRGFELGSYPTRQVGDKKLVAELNKLPKTWVSYGYYRGTGAYGSMTPSDYMKYADVYYEGNKFRAVTFSSYRPDNTSGTGEGGSYQMDNGYYPDTVYWFIFEPLRWSILDASTGLILCDTIVDSQPFNNNLYLQIAGGAEYGVDYVYHSYYQRYLDETGVLNYYSAPGCSANNYSTSSIREWLNDDFYNTAFTSVQKEMINTSAISSLTDSTGENAVTTFDKVFLPSIMELLTYSWNPILINPSAYAMCQGLMSPMASPWRLRDGGFDSGAAMNIEDLADWDDMWSTDLVFFGIRPAMTIDLGYVSSQAEKQENVEQSAVADFVTASGESIGYEFENCVPGKKYILMNVADYSESFTLTEDNLYYIDELSADENGRVSGNFIPKINDPSSTTLLFGKTKPCTVKITDIPKKVIYKSTFNLGLQTENATGDEQIKWTSSDNRIMRVDQSGKVSVVGFGTATITVSVEGTNSSDSVTFTTKLAWWQWIIVILLFGWIWY